jgi:hypothetical protein
MLTKYSFSWEWHKNLFSWECSTYVMKSAVSWEWLFFMRVTPTATKLGLLVFSTKINYLNTGNSRTWTNVFTFNLQRNFVTNLSPSCQLQMWWFFFLNISKIMLYQFILKLKFWIVQTNSDGEMIDTKVVDLDDFKKIVVEDFLLNSFIVWKLCLIQFKV